MNKTRKRPAWVRAARKAIAAHLPAIRKAMAEAFEPHELAIVPRGMDWEDCADENAAEVKRMFGLVNDLNNMVRAVACAVSPYVRATSGKDWPGDDIWEHSNWTDWIDDVVTDRWREAINELPERESDV